MKLKVSLVLLICGFAVFSGIAFYLTSNLFKMQVISGKPQAIEKKVTPVPKSLADAVIEVGTETDGKARAESRVPPRVSRYAPGQVLPSASVAPVQDTGAPVGTVTHLTGVASVVDDAGTAHLLTMRADIFRMDRIETGPNTKLEIKLIDGTVVSQGERSVILIEECVYIPDNPTSCGFVMRFTRGLCRVVTGLITDVNPNRFKVKARMATVGIRGCDLVFKSTPDRNDIYVLDMGRSKSVEVLTTSDGSSVTDPDSGRELDVDNSKKQRITVNQPQNVVSIVRGRGPEEHNIGADEARSLISETSRMTPAHYELQQKSDGAVLKLSPPTPHAKP